ncbi:MAG: hypothetical protein R3C19_21185 [Planctomycetaceae bacterium]
MKCVDARHLIHLSVGDDTHPDEEQQLSEHLHSCSDCRAYNAGTVDALQVLQTLRDNTPDESESVWPAVAAEIQARRVRPLRRVRQFNGAVAAMCACSLTLALVTIVQNLPANSREYSGNVMPAFSVQWQNHPSSQSVGEIRPIDPNNPSAGFYNTVTREIYPPALPASSVTDF